MRTCDKPTEVFSRVVGYHRPVKNWNKGKQAEFRDRLTYRGCCRTTPPAKQTST